MSDYEWTPLEPILPPAEPMPVLPAETEFYCRDANGQLVEAGEFFKRYAEGLLADPQWHAEQERKQQEKAAKKKAREQRREQTK